MRVSLSRQFVAALIALLAALPALAQERGATSKPEPAGPPPSIADRTKNLTKIDGFFPMYWDENGGKLFVEIPKLDTEVLYATGLATGLGSNDIGLDRGITTGSRIVTFERAGPRILMVQPNYQFRALTQNAAEARTVRDAFARSVLWSFQVAALSDGRVLVDYTDFLVRDWHEMAGRLSPGTYRFEAARSSVYRPGLAAFPKNTEMEAELTFVRQPAGAGGGPAAADAAAAPVRDGSSKGSAASRPRPKPRACACTTRSSSCRNPASSRAPTIRARGSARCRTRTTRRCRTSR